jgi:hypothetical protein
MNSYARLEIAQELFLRDSAVLQNDAQKSDANLLRGHGDVDPSVGERHVAAPLPDCAEAELIAENLDEYLAFDRSEPQAKLRLLSPFV